jgi:hypothetical protein
VDPGFVLVQFDANLARARTIVREYVETTLAQDFVTA